MTPETIVIITVGGFYLVLAIAWVMDFFID